MKITIHKGTNQIGGCITEIQSNNGTRIIIDIGEDLPSMDGIKKPELNLNGLTKGKVEFNAVIVTHYHGDHIGHFNRVLPQIPIYIGEHSKAIYKILQTRLVKAGLESERNLELIDKFIAYKILKKIKIQDITITPIEVDHSAFNAHMLLVECDGKKLLHTGDFRMHGQRGKALIQTLEKYVQKVDCLICEGTTFSRTKELPMTERELQNKAEQIFKNNKYTFVLCSSTNIDRIAAFHKAALKTNKLFICDNYQKQILMYIDSISRSGLYAFNDTILSYGKNINNYMRDRGFVMLVRANYISPKVMAKFPKSAFIYSQYLGYLNKEYKEYKVLQELVPEDYIYLHTSGHVDYSGIKKIINVINPEVVIPIHTENKEMINELTKKAVILEDNEVYELK